MEFNESSIICSYIQNLLYNFYIPVINIVESADDYDAQVNEHFITKNGAIYLNTDTGKKLISTYTPGKNYVGLTRNIISESNNYNIDLHEQLGNYIRFLRDYYNFDIMPLYNCFSNRFIDSFSLPITNERKKGSTIKPGFKLFAFPVRFGHKYSIFCKNNCQALTQLAFFNGKKPLEIYYRIPGLSDQKSWICFEPTSVSLSQWEEHIVELNTLNTYAESIAETISPEYKDSVAYTLRVNQVNLYLFVQIPENNADNLIVIENNSNVVINNTLIQNHSQKPFSDKLLGYLLNYFINPINPIQENIEKYQKILSSHDFYIRDEEGNKISDTPMVLKNYVKGSFDYVTRDFIYNLYRFAGIDDFTGYIDKDVETHIVNDINDYKGN